MVHWLHPVPVQQWKEGPTQACTHNGEMKVKAEYGCVAYIENNEEDLGSA